MPTTRSRGRCEPHQVYTPPRRQRKQSLNKRPLSFREITPEPEQPSVPITSDITFIARQRLGPNMFHIEKRYSDASTQSFVVEYVDASTQTNEVVILTKFQIADSRDQPSTSISNKRIRDDESEEEPTAKRHQFSTPQNERSNNLWMFGEKANGDHPRTAPSKSLVSSSLRRPMRGPISRRTHFNDSPKRHLKINKDARPRDPELAIIKPIELEIENNESEGQTKNGGNGHQTEEEPQTGDVQQTPRRGLFGSLRGMVHKGWDIAAQLSPLTKTEPRPASTAPPPQPGHIEYPRLRPTGEDDQVEENGVEEMQNNRPRRVRASDPSGRSNQFDHLHYIPADAESVDKAMNGEIAPPDRSPTPPSPASRAKAQNPQLSDATIESILKKRERKAALDEARYGPRKTPQASTVAPLFGPDSHYSRGTVDPRFLPATPLFGPSKKRKAEVASEETPGLRNRSFGLDLDETEGDIDINHADNTVTEEHADIGTPSKRQKTNQNSNNHVTPRSVLKKPGFSSSVGRKSVAFGESMSRDIRGHYGRAGQYNGSTFADESPDDSSLSSLPETADFISPSTRLNTVANSVRKPASARESFGTDIPAIDFTLRDPNDPDWRPSLGNPRPGTFRVPDIDEEDPDESMGDDPPEQPQTPRMSHAELPAAPNTNGSTSFNESSIVHESTELALDKARSKIEKYKPRASSRLSEVSRARSRSTSPDEEEDENILSTSSASPVKPIGVPPEPYVPCDLDNTKKGSDGMTDHEREHQYDEWAAGLDWNEPQTYEDAGTASAFIQNLIRKNWSAEDTRRSETFWALEFDEVDRAMEAAKVHGKKLTLVTGMEGIESY